MRKIFFGVGLIKISNYNDRKTSSLFSSALLKKTLFAFPRHTSIKMGVEVAYIT